jgi:outer membrane protein assembly factor BamD
MKIKHLLLSILVISLFSSCAQKDPEYNKPALYWYNKMIKSIKLFDLDKADDFYTSLQSEHRNSPLVAEASLILANAHSDEEEYMLSKFYYDEYIKRNSNKQNIDYIEYLKIKASFMGFKYQYREQQLTDDLINETTVFIARYPKSHYIEYVKDIQSRVYMAKLLLNQEIVHLYKKLDKPKAVIYYQNKLNLNWLNPKTIEDVDVPWYRAIFEW